MAHNYVDVESSVLSPKRLSRKRIVELYRLTLGIES